MPHDIIGIKLSIGNSVVMDIERKVGDKTVDFDIVCPLCGNKTKITENQAKGNDVIKCPTKGCPFTVTLDL